MAFNEHKDIDEAEKYLNECAAIKEYSLEDMFQTRIKAARRHIERVRKNIA